MRDTSHRDRIAALIRRYDLAVSADERQAFEDWDTQRSRDAIAISHPADALAHLSPAPKPGHERAEVRFALRHTAEELHAVLDAWRMEDPRFEIAVHDHGPEEFSVEIGNKMGGTSPREDALYVGHYHPTLAYPIASDLPAAFVRGVMPSGGDVRGFIRYPAAIRNGTRIYAADAVAELSLAKPSESYAFDIAAARALDEFTGAYFALFEGENRLGIHTDNEVATLFLDRFGLRVTFL